MCIKLKELLSWKTKKGELGKVDLPKGHIVVYVGESRKRFVVPLSYLKHHLFQALLKRMEEEFGFRQQMGGLNIPCSEGEFAAVISGMQS
ncbi:hypothetical protein HPP92_025407 [Vanilla planifolia]|uniref:Small auxin up regulated protein n=1 Tax=Vanilla planifolia TaxID=51239 RepID=A0A835UAF6_VANPL|nr:hypothetical protein HPP92_025407 [Vanilla planifolia]